MAATIKVGGVPEHFNWPWRQAVADDAFNQAGLALQYTEYPGGTGAMTRALAAGELDVALLLTEGALADAVNNPGNVLVKTFVRSPLTWGIHVAAGSPIRKITETRGKRVAVSRMGSGSHLMAIVDAERRGWSIRDMKFVIVSDLEGAREALARGKADVFFWERYTTSPLVQRGEFRRVGQRVTPWPAFCVSVRRDLLKRRRKALKRLLETVDRYAHNFMRRSTAVETIINEYRLQADDAQRWFNDVRWASGFRRPDADLKKTLTALSRCGVISDNEVELEQVWQQL